MTMDRDLRDVLIAFAIGAAIVLLILCTFGVRKAQAQSPAYLPPVDLTMCAPQARSCKVVTISPEEENTLFGPDMIWDQALWARQQFGPLLKAWREKIQNAPAGKLYAEPAPTSSVPAPK